MSRKYQQIVNKTKGKARKRVKLPQKIQDYMTNLTVDLKDAQINLNKMEIVKMNIWQAFDSLKQTVRILQQKDLIGKYEEWKDLMCEDCKYKKKLMEDVIELELTGIIKGEGKEKEIDFVYEDWDIFLDEVKEKPPKITKVNDESKGKVTKTSLTKLNVPEEYKPLDDISVNRKDEKYTKRTRRIRCKTCEKLYNKTEMKNHKCEGKK